MIAPGVDVRADGGYAILPPSMHGSGQPYTWASTHDLAPWPDWLGQLNGRPQERFDLAGALAGAPDGERDNALFKLACVLRRYDIQYDIAESVVLFAASRCTPPVPDAHARDRLQRAYRNYQPEPDTPVIAPRRNGVVYL